MKFRVINILLIILCLCGLWMKDNIAQSAAGGPSGPVKVEVASKRIPSGTAVPIKIGTAINTISSSVGDQFYATLTNDIKVDNTVVLPAGSVIRGTIGQVKRSRLLSSGGQILLMFDHVVTPVGKQIPVYAYIKDNDNVNCDGNLTAGTSYKKEFIKGFNKGKAITVNATKWGVSTGADVWGGAPLAITAPVGAIGGFFGGTGYFLGKTIISIFQKGGEVFIAPGQIITIVLAQPLDVPVN